MVLKVINVFQVHYFNVTYNKTDKLIHILCLCNFFILAQKQFSELGGVQNTEQRH